MDKKRKKTERMQLSGRTKKLAEKKGWWQTESNKKIKNSEKKLRYRAAV